MIQQKPGQLSLPLGAVIRKHVSESGIPSLLITFTAPRTHTTWSRWVHCTDPGHYQQGSFTKSENTVGQTPSNADRQITGGMPQMGCEMIVMVWPEPLPELNTNLYLMMIMIDLVCHITTCMLNCVSNSLTNVCTGHNHSSTSVLNETQPTTQS